jgi:DNA repair photolyase
MGLLDPICCGMWSVTPYERCDFRCVYCCTRVQGRSEAPGPTPAVLDAFRAALRDVPADELLILGAFSDAYPPVEAETGLTRAIVTEIIRQQRPLTIVTKGTTVRRDADLLRRHRGAQCLVQISISSVDDAVLRRMDPGAPSIDERFETLLALRDAGVEVNVNLLPWIPGVTDTDAIIARTPSDVEIVVAPLAVSAYGDRIKMLGRTFLREEVNAAYMDEYRRLGHVRNTSWVKPSPPPTENDPLYRLPVLEEAAG